MALQVKIVTPEGVTWEGEADGVRLPVVYGDMGIRSGHQPVLAALHEGTVYIDQGGKRSEVQISEGFLSFDSDIVTVVSADTPMSEWGPLDA